MSWTTALPGLSTKPLYACWTKTPLITTIISVHNSVWGSIPFPTGVVMTTSVS